MARQVLVRLWRGKRDALPMAAPSGTPMWCEDTHQLWIGTDDDRVLVAGPDDESDAPDASALVTRNGEYVLTAGGQPLAIQPRPESPLRTAAGDALTTQQGESLAIQPRPQSPLHTATQQSLTTQQGQALAVYGAY